MTTDCPSVYLNAACLAMRLAVDCRRTRNDYDTRMAAEHGRRI
jgi:hypothetical protein